jgi:hypothetical protein
VKRRYYDPCDGSRVVKWRCFEPGQERCYCQKFANPLAMSTRARRDAMTATTWEPGLPLHTTRGHGGWS